jgi:hypothetical protein
MANNIELFKAYLPMLDEVYKHASLTSVLDGAPELARQGVNANELIIQKMSMAGLANYSRNGGYVDGDVTLTNETVKCNFDRGRMFTVDALDNMETAAMAYGRLAGEFTRTRVIPELDAFRLSTYASAEGIGKKAETLSTGAAVVKALRAAHVAMDDEEVPPENRILFIASAIKGAVDDLDTTASRAVMDMASQVIVVPQSRFYTAIVQHDGTTGGQTDGGYAKAEGGFPINFLLVHKDAVIQHQKHVVPKVVTPEQNQTADAWKFGYRNVGIAEVYENKVAGIYCSYAGA